MIDLMPARLAAMFACRGAHDYIVYRRAETFTYEIHRLEEPESYACPFFVLIDG